MKTIPNKTDRNDARAFAQIIRTGWYRRVHVKSRQRRLWRSLLVARRTVLNEMRTLENVVRAILREASRNAVASRVRDLAGIDPVVTPLVEPLLAILAQQEMVGPQSMGMNIARRRGMARAGSRSPASSPPSCIA